MPLREFNDIYNKLFHTRRYCAESVQQHILQRWFRNHVSSILTFLSPGKSWTRKDEKNSQNYNPSIYGLIVEETKVDLIKNNFTQLFIYNPQAVCWVPWKGSMKFESNCACLFATQAKGWENQYMYKLDAVRKRKLRRQNQLVRRQKTEGVITKLSD
jgi:hypothetical protein